MPPPADASATGGRLSGEDMTEYMETFAATFLSGRIRYHTEVLKISRTQAKDGWFVVVRNLKTQAVERIVYDKLVLCTGVTSLSVGVLAWAEVCFASRRGVASRIYLRL